YAELNTRANRLAHHLRTLGVGPDSRVAVVLERSAELIAAELAIVKCGAAYVPIDPAVPGERLTFMVEDCEAKLVLAVRAATLPEAWTARRIDVDALLPSEGMAGNLKVALDSEAAAYVMYTSGSTGRPKGVEIPHRAIARLVLNNGYAQFDASDRVAFAANPA